MYCKDKVLNKSLKFMMIVLFISFFWLSAGHLQAADVDTLVQDLKDNDLIVRLHAAKALGEAKDARAVEPLIAALGDKGCGHTAANALAKIGKPAVEPLTSALKDESPAVRRNAAIALREMGKPEAVVVDILY